MEEEQIDDVEEEAHLPDDEGEAQEDLTPTEEEGLTSDERRELEDLRKKDFNFRKLRSQTKEGKEEIKRGKQEIEENWKEFRESIIKERQTDALDLLVGDDEEMRKKVLYNFNRIDPNKPAVTKEAIYKRMREAANMEGVDARPNVISRGGHSGYRGTTQPVESDTSKKLREEFKISDETKDKYSKEDWKPKY